MKQNSENQSHSMQNIYALKDVIDRILLHLTEFKLKKSVISKFEKVQKFKVESSREFTDCSKPFIPTDEYIDPNDLLVAGEYPKTSTEHLK